MRILVITVTRNRKGQALRTERPVEGELIRLGRGTQCEIHLADPRVSLYHAAIYRQGDSVFIQAPEADLSVNGEAEREARLVPGTHVALGPYDFTVEAPRDDYDLALAVELARPMPDDLAEIRAKSRITLEQSGLSRRTSSWTLLLLIGGLFLALPVINALLPPLRPLTAKLLITPDQSWNPGVLSLKHQKLGHSCFSCHEIPFVPVRDQACLACHRGTPGHVATVALQQRLFAGTRCESCHAEHKGPVAVVRRDAVLCVSCHGALKRRDPDTTLADATDFAADHPPFKLTIWQGPDARNAIRVAQTERMHLIESSRLKFPHDTHLKSSVRSPTGRKTLTCASCHVADGASFAPIHMEQACIECHSLEFEPAAIPPQQVEHDSTARTQLTISERALLTIDQFYASIALNDKPVDVVVPDDILRGLPRFSGGVMSEAQRQQRSAWARDKAQQVSEDLFEKRVCIVCHEVAKTMTAGEQGVQTATWTVAPIHVDVSWLPKARFDHAKHSFGNIACADCHKVESVEGLHPTSDVSIPDIAKCRECHGGNAPAAGRFASTCVACHGFHLPGHPPFGAIAAATPPSAR